MGKSNTQGHRHKLEITLTPGVSLNCGYDVTKVPLTVIWLPQLLQPCISPYSALLGYHVLQTTLPPQYNNSLKCLLVLGPCIEGLQRASHILLLSARQKWPYSEFFIQNRDSQPVTKLNKAAKRARMRDGILPYVSRTTAHLARSVWCYVGIITSKPCDTLFYIKISMHGYFI